MLKNFSVDFVDIGEGGFYLFRKDLVDLLYWYVWELMFLLDGIVIWLFFYFDG